MSKLTPLQNKTMEELWSNLDDYRQQLKFREWELLNQYEEADTNIGGGKSSNISNPTEQKALILAGDKKYQYLKSIVHAIDQVYKELDEDEKKIIDMKFFEKRSCYEWKHIADKLYMSTWQVLRKRNFIFDETGKRLGWI